MAAVGVPCGSGSVRSKVKSQKSKVNSRWQASIQECTSLMRNLVANCSMNDCPLYCCVEGERNDVCVCMCVYRGWVRILPVQ